MSVLSRLQIAVVFQTRVRQGISRCRCRGLHRLPPAGLLCASDCLTWLAASDGWHCGCGRTISRESLIGYLTCLWIENRKGGLYLKKICRSVCLVDFGWRRRIIGEMMRGTQLRWLRREVSKCVLEKVVGARGQTHMLPSRYHSKDKARICLRFWSSSSQPRLE